MIFVTVGAQMPFDRLTRTMDAWAGRGNPHDVFAQIGSTAWEPAYMDWTPTLDALAYRECLASAKAIVSHAGVGTILTALEFGKPLIVVPRCARFREAPNDHQHDTARAFADSGRVTVAWNESELVDRLESIDRLPAPPRIGEHASIELLESLRAFIHRGAAAVAAGPVRTVPFAPTDAETTGRRQAA